MGWTLCLKPVPVQTHHRQVCLCGLTGTAQRYGCAYQKAQIPSSFGTSSPSSQQYENTHTQGWGKDNDHHCYSNDISVCVVKVRSIQHIAQMRPLSLSVCLSVSIFLFFFMQNNWLLHEKRPVWCKCTPCFHCILLNDVHSVPLVCSGHCFFLSAGIQLG